MEFKKHKSHMTQNELRFLKRVINQRVMSMMKSEHYNSRQKERVDGLTSYEVLKLFRYSKYDIVECHNAYRDNNGSFRVVLRSHDHTDDKNYIIVLDIMKRKIVTVYTNHIKDNHVTLNKSRYYNYSSFYLHERYSRLSN